MRKMKLLLFAALLTMTFALSACGSNDVKKESSTATKKEETKQEESKAEESKEEESKQEEPTDATDNGGDAISGKFGSIEEYVNNPTIKEQLDKVIALLDGTGMKLDIKADDNKLIYTYTYEEVLKTDEVKQTLEDGMETQKSTFISSATSLKDYVEIENPVVVVEYVDANGELICSREFAAE